VIDYLKAARCIDVNENAIDCGALTGMGGNGMAVVEMRERLQVQFRYPLTAEPERSGPGSRVERANRFELPIGDTELPVG
jgi:hypothetical protein